MTQVSQVPSVAQATPNTVVVDGIAFEGLADAVDYTQANPSLAPFTIFLGAGEYLIERSLIMDTVAVSFQGAGKGRTILTFDRTNEDATNYWIRTATTGDPEYAPRIAFAYCGYTDQTTYGLVSEASWEGRWSIRDLTVQLQYSGDRTSACAIIPVYSRPDNAHASTWDLIDIEFKTKNSPVRKPNSNPDFAAIWHDPTSIPAAESDVSAKHQINIVRCDFHGMQRMTGTCSITSGLSALTGSGTAFTTELFVGGFIQLDNYTYEIATITDDTNATIVGTASATESAVEGMAIHPWSEAININTHELQISPQLTIRDCSFDWVLDRIVFSYANELYVENVNAYNCTVHDTNHVTPDVQDAMFYHFGQASYSGIKAELYGYLNNILTGQFWAVFGGSGQNASEYRACRVVNGSNTYQYRCGLWSTDQLVKATDCEFGGTYQGYLYGALLDGTYGLRSSFANCVFGAASPNHSLRMTGTGHSESAFVNCHFDEIVETDSLQQKVKFTACVFDDDVIIDGDDTVIQGCQITESGKDLTINGAYECRIIGNWFNGGIELTGSPIGTLIEANYVYNPIFGQVGAKSRIVGNRVEGHVSHGGLALNDDVVLSGNVWDIRHDNFFDTTGGANRLAITGNIFTQAGSSTAAVLFQLSTSLSDHIAFANNVIYLDSTLASYDCLVSDGKISITGNKFYGCDQGATYSVIDTTSYYCVISDNFFQTATTFAGDVIGAGSNGWNTIHGNIIEFTGSVAAVGIDSDGDHCTIIGNSIIWTGGARTGINNSGDYVTIIGNSIYRGATPTGNGIINTGANTQVANNAVN